MKLLARGRTAVHMPVLQRLHDEGSEMATEPTTETKTETKTEPKAKSE